MVSNFGAIPPKWQLLMENMMIIHSPVPHDAQLVTVYVLATGGHYPAENGFRLGYIGPS